MTDKKKSYRISPKEKAEIILLWKSGDYTLEQLAEKFDRNISSIKALISVSGAKKGESASIVAQKVAAEAERNLLSEVQLIAQKIKETRDKHYKYADGIALLTWNTILKAKQDNVPIAAIANDMKALQLASSIMKTCREEKFAALGVDVKSANDDQPLPDLVVQELTVEDIKEMHRQQAMQNGEEDALGDLNLGDEELDEELDDRVETE